MEIWIATSNSGKLNEFRSLLMDLGVDIHSASELEFYSSPAETGDTFEANARIKAKSLHAVKNNVWVIADDSGLEAEGLNNLPGIHSARYAGDHASDSMNNAKLLKMLKIRSANRKARFVCTLIAISPTGEEHLVTGVLNGEIAPSAHGSGGFGYDPIFIPENEQKSLAELGPAVKNKISHRGQAIRSLKNILNND